MPSGRLRPRRASDQGLTVENLIARVIHKCKSYLVKPPGVIPLAYIAQFLPPNPVVVEAGAHLGLDTLAMSRRWPDGHIHAFEPVPELFEQLSARVARHRNVTCYPVALGAAVGTANMYVSGGASNASSSLSRPKGHLTDHPDVTFPREIAVQTTTLDAWANASHVSHVDLLWLDMQGHELAAIKAAPGILQTVRAICTEVYLKESYTGVLLYAEAREYLQYRRFRVQREELPWPDAGNVLCVRQDGWLGKGPRRSR